MPMMRTCSMTADADDAQALGPSLQSSFCSGPADADDAQALGTSLFPFPSAGQLMLMMRTYSRTADADDAQARGLSF